MTITIDADRVSLYATPRITTARCSGCGFTARSTYMLLNWADVSNYCPECDNDEAVVRWLLSDGSSVLTIAGEVIA